MAEYIAKGDNRFHNLVIAREKGFSKINRKPKEVCIILHSTYVFM
jgi:hypothetical protein